MLSKDQMVKVIQAAQEAARKAIEATYFGSFCVTEQRKVRDEKSKLTKTESVIVLENQPCKLSFETVKTAAVSNAAAVVTQITRLFVSPEISIKPGSKITVTQDGITTDYTHSGVPAVYPTHQEILLELFERWA